MMNLTAAYVAGFFDGEGCVLIVKDTQLRNKNPRTDYWLRVNLTNTDRRPLDFLRGRFGGRVHTSTPTSLTTRVAWAWDCTGKAAKDFLLWIRPHTLIKACQIWLGLEFQEQRQDCRGRIVYIEEQSLREGYYLALQAAKRLP